VVTDPRVSRVDPCISRVDPCVALLPACGSLHAKGSAVVLPAPSGGCRNERPDLVAAREVCSDGGSPAAGRLLGGNG
jgi:hypothetical protein